jgi:hypothetical protein
VVLVDTAGRMQNKEPLMRALAKLVSDNEPDLVLFVGEALVGNDGIDQLSVFNQALANYSPPGACSVLLCFALLCFAWGLLTGPHSPITFALLCLSMLARARRPKPTN